MVRTPLALKIIEQYGVTDQHSVSVDVSSQGIISLVESAIKETHGGKFWFYHGKEKTW
jgi:hypothetical protein